jgi:hypothetical protein
VRLKTRDDLIYDLIFSEKIQYKIDISEYVSDIYKYEEFIAEIKKVLKKSKVFIIKSDVLLDSKTATWDLKVKK